MNEDALTGLQIPNESLFQEVESLIYHLRRDPAFLEWKKQQPPPPPSIYPTPGTPEAVIADREARIAFMLKAGATEGEINSFNWALFGNDHFGPGGTVWSALDALSPTSKGPKTPRNTLPKPAGEGFVLRSINSFHPSTGNGSPHKNLSGSIEDAASIARSYPYRPDAVSRHAIERMNTRGVSYESIQETVAKGTRTFDSVTGKATYTLRSSESSSGRGVFVVRNEVTGTIITVIDKGSK